MQCPVSHATTESPISAVPAMKCPFNHGQNAPSGPQSEPDSSSNQHQTAPHSGGKQQPAETAAALNGCPLGYAESRPTQETATPAVCPLGYEPQSNAALSQTQADEDAQPPAQCPMGFTASDGPRMTQFHCVICKSLLYDCVQLSCSCKYCRHCVQNFKDCPLCGADIHSRSPAPELQGLVDKYINAHAGTQNLFDIGTPTNDVKVGEASSQSRSAFLLQLAVRSAAGGNHPAAIHRLQLCKTELLKQVEEEGHTSSLCSQLGAVCGSQGDCHRQLDQPEQAKACYEESVLHLKACQSDGLEIVHPLSVSYNKLGDLEYGAGNVGAGLRWYQQGLAVREQALSSSQHAGPSEQLDVAVSIIKVADACQALGHEEEANRSFNQALQLVKDIQNKNADSPAVIGRCTGLLSFLESRQSQQ